MFTDLFARANRCYTCCLMGVALQLGLACLLLGLNGSRTWHLEREYRTQRDLLLRQQAAWQAQRIETYTVVYDNCNSLFCCQNTLLAVQDDYIAELPACANNGYGLYRNNYYGSTYNAHYYIASVDEQFEWLADWMEVNRRNAPQIEYHPELHYITQVRLTPWAGAQEIVIEYRELTVP